MKTPTLAAIVLSAITAVCADTVTYLVDFGAPEHTPYVFHEGDFGLKIKPVVVSEPAAGEYSGFGYKEARFQLGAAQLVLPSVGAYNLGESGPSTAALTGSFFFSNAGRAEVGSPVTFELIAPSRATRITVAAIGSVQEGQHALVTLEGTRMLVDSSEGFVQITAKLSGKTKYTGSFEAENEGGEANLGGLLITIETP